MNIGGSDGPGSSIGDQLNRMSGAQDPNASLYQDKDKTKMGKEAFLKLFMEQLKFQDPMNPVKNEQFSQQMAMFSQLEQQVNMNKNLEKMIAGQNNHQIAALQLVGKNILADRAALYHTKNDSTAFSFKIPQDLNEIKVDIIDPAGETLKSYNLGARNEGDVAWRWDGTDENGRPVDSGKYSFRVVGKDPGGKDVSINTKVEGKVSGVTSAGGAVFLLVGEQRIGLNDVETIKEASVNDKTTDKKADGIKDESVKVAGPQQGEGPELGVKSEASPAKAVEEPPPELVQAARQMLGNSSGDESEAKFERLDGNLSKSSGLLPLMYR